MPHVQRQTHDEYNIKTNVFLKYILFVYNFTLWSIAVSILAIGIWSMSEKNIFRNVRELTYMLLDPAFVLVIVGIVTFIIGFSGCVGALRENSTLLYLHAVLLVIILLFEVICGGLLIIFKDWIKSEAIVGFQTFIVRYREDIDQQNFIDWVQEEWLQCCGVESPKDWDQNEYFNCSPPLSGNSEACGVPFSCCKRNLGELIKNKQCGYDVRKNNTDISKIIFEKGCIHALEDWIEQNLLNITFIMFAITFLKVLGISFAQTLRSDIIAQKELW